ncbi:MAG TPA: Ig-like domain-containing protein, partial [Polyangiaceae bacterium]|nr:Ig-like domain-containing protein [Polyangiaceae bacterium]
MAHNALATEFSWSFATGAAPDTTSPTVSSTSPAASASNVPINTLITASFSESMNPLTITVANFTLACPVGAPVTGSVGYAVSGNVATFTPASSLPANTTCSARVTTGAKDVAGNAMVSAVDWSFTTGAGPDITAPTVSSTSPAGSTTGVAINTLITASFSEPMNPLTITSATFELACPAGTAITGTLGYAVNGNVATFIPAADLPASTMCTATITSAVADTAGNTLVNPFSWNFTTGAAPDNTAPTVSSTSPAASASNVPINTLITASFSESMNPLTLTPVQFTVDCPSGTPVPGTVAYAVNGNIATFTPADNLPASTACIARITAGVEDVAHNAMISPIAWAFTTGVAPDVAAPAVNSTNPADSAVGVCINKTVNATFSEPMDPLTITTATFTLAITAGASVTGVVAYDAQTNIATFDPAADLTGATATQYTA